MDSYMVGLAAWIILHEPIHNGQTIFDIYYKKQQNKIKHERVRKTFASWTGAVPSIYEILSITEEKDLGKAFIKEKKGHFWLMTEIRPYMREKAALAAVQYNLGDKSSAIENYEELLELNPNDNQGIRYLLLPIYLEEEKYEEAKELIHEFDVEISANFLFNNVLLHYSRDGLTTKTKSLCKRLFNWKEIRSRTQV
ncbi:hypothetical protein CWR48_17550 [Oceanobacillus arenosus]|uniref:Uncharacterized protein n=1 Tax=Oceanobacillus arenosus TaxID=1229153 RepID=A0A3D8PIT0_9BACI|nr:tetratricopeptide repeat protein [Oceanobacillus arenosus]RDW16003.1 hypothetical protein CWR48_17550 [Oceanobacillus arenosus]